MDFETAEEYIPGIETAANRAAALCRQMLAYAGKAQSVLAQVDMAEVVNEMVTMLKATTNQNVSIRADLPPSMPNINGDVSQCDLDSHSGLRTVIDMIEKQDLPVPVVEFTRGDIVRSGICAMWVNAFEEAHI